MKLSENTIIRAIGVAMMIAGVILAVAAIHQAIELVTR